MVGRPSGGSRSGRETLREVRKWLGDPPGVPEVVGRPSPRSEVVSRPSRRSCSHQKTLWEVRMWLVGPPEGSEVVRRPSGRSGSVRETLQEVRKW